MTADVSIPDLVRWAALFYWTDLPDPAPEHPRTLVRRDGYAVSVFPGLSFGEVLVETIHPDRIGQVVEEARALLAAHGKSQGAWVVAEAATPIGLVDELRSRGMVPWEEAPLEPRSAAMVAVNTSIWCRMVMNVSSRPSIAKKASGNATRRTTEQDTSPSFHWWPLSAPVIVT